MTGVLDGRLGELDAAVVRGAGGDRVAAGPEGGGAGDRAGDRACPVDGVAGAAAEPVAVAAAVPGVPGAHPGTDTTADPSSQQESLLLAYRVS